MTPTPRPSAATLPPSFYARPAIVVAPELLNKVFRFGACSGRIVEVEAYSEDDPASHTFCGPTPRNAPMFGPPGRLYVYLSYGIHHCVNLVCGEIGHGQAVLLRAVVPLDGLAVMRRRRQRPGAKPLDDRRLADGPGKLCQAFGIDRGDNDAAATVVDDGVPSPSSPRIGPRVGITKAVDWPRRFRTPIGSP